ncbi:hypothetical protein O0Q50_28445 [Priestia aryabhattai]|uniref:Uncharacterized protein n=1 Tax=Priestia aryabhattai TaxID=412384 RepID=A0AAX6NGU6_PRIAR|nr:hypothetical protein [Priestia aryabhattai]MDU9695131.1 hypothetical protein [Priestia aryabhattai]
MAKNNKRKGVKNANSVKMNVSNPTATKKNVHNGKSPATLFNNSLIVDFSYKDWLKSISNKGFSNKLFDESQFAKFMFDVLYKIFPTVQTNWETIRTQPGKGFRHCHPVDEDKLPVVKKIVQELHGNIAVDIEESESLRYWQFGTTQSVRVVGIYDNARNVVYPLFIDYHHLIHASQKHNQNDHKAYKFCPYCYYERQLAYK